MTALSHGWSVLPSKDIGCNSNISIFDIWFREDVGNNYDRQDIKNLFISTDFPSMSRYLFKFYSDETIKQLNENTFQMDEQIARALILHQMLGTRISDTLTLKIDCLSIRENRYFIRIEQVKSITFEKAISDKIAQLIIKSIDYTEEHYGKTKHIFVKKMIHRDHFSIACSKIESCKKV